MAYASTVYAGVGDQASLERANALIAKVTGRPIDHLPTVYGPAAVAQIAALQRGAQARLDQANKEVDQRLADHKAKSERITAEAEQAKVGPLRTQAEAAASQAETNRRLQERPYTMGPGYGLDPRSPQPKTLGPSGQATQAPRSPEGQAAYNTLSSEFNAGSEKFGEATEAYNRLVPLAKDKTNTSDRAILQAFVKLTDPGQVVGASFARETAGLGTLRQQAESELNRLFRDDKGTMAEDLRANFVKTAKKIHALQIDQHLQLRDEIRHKATNQGLPLDEVAPNRLTTYGSGGKAITQQKLKEYLAAHPGVTRGQAILDLADGKTSYYVRGGPE